MLISSLPSPPLPPGVGSSGTRDGAAVPSSSGGGAFHDSPLNVLRANQALDMGKLAEERRKQAAKAAMEEELALVRGGERGRGREVNERRGR